MGIAVVRLGVVVNDLRGADFSGVESHLDQGCVPERPSGLALQAGRSQESGGSKGGEGDEGKNADEGKAGGVDPKFFMGKSFHGSFTLWDNRF